MRETLLELLTSALLGLGLVLMASTVLLWWWIAGDYQRYVWIINGPPPYDQFGDGPFQLVMYTSLFLIVIVITAAALMLRAVLRRLG